MSNENTRYFRLAGRSLQQMEDWQKLSASMQRKRKLFVRKIFPEGMADVIVDIHRGARSIFTGILTDRVFPPGWRVNRKNTWRKGQLCVPDLKTKDGRAYAKEMKTLETPICPVVTTYLNGLTLSTSGFEKHGDDWYVSQHEKATPPTDAVPVKRSEYWAMVEKEENK